MQGGARVLPLLLILSCAPASTVDLSPEAWRQNVTAARPGEHDVWLERLKLKPVINQTWTTPGLESVELRTAKLSGGKKPEVLVVATFKATVARERELLSDEVTLYRVQVLQPSGSTWCAISDALSADVIVEDYNAGPVDGMKDTWLPWRFSFINFSRTNQQTIEVRKPFDNVSRLSGKGEVVEWWDLVEGKLVPLAKTSVARTVCGPCKYPHHRTWFELHGTPPVILVDFTLQCVDDSERLCPLKERHVRAPTWQEVQ